MRTEITAEKAEGRTIEKIDFGGSQCVITFTDRTFTTLGMEFGYDPGGNEIVGEPLYLMSYCHSALLSLGILSEHELNERINKRNEAAATNSEKRDWELYERLKQKFEGGAAAESTEKNQAYQDADGDEVPF